VGALASITAVLIIGLIGVAVNAHQVVRHGVDAGKLQFWGLVFSVVGAFISFVIGGWVAGKIAGILRSETAMLHGAIVWLLTVPLMLGLAALGSGTYFGGWHGGLAARNYHYTAPTTPMAATVGVPPAGAEAGTTRPMTAQEQEDAFARAARNSALGAVTALLLGLVGGVIGGWMASGEPMHPFYYRTRSLNVGHTRV
jgi:hypothetical protein